ncbi:MAG TPA: hypothetical protein VNO35_35900 [Steroidobacteraceae bacterium]|nr:hypothetical protein [Steroidobacteraceae bacterium]
MPNASREMSTSRFLLLTASAAMSVGPAYATDFNITSPSTAAQTLGAVAGKTGYLYIFDRVTGEPLQGMPNKPVPQEPRQLTSATQPIPVGDPFVPLCPDARVEPSLRHQSPRLAEAHRLVPLDQRHADNCRRRDVHRST